MLILSRVAAMFHDKAGNEILRIRPDQLMTFITAPESIMDDPLFNGLVADGSLEAVESVSRKKQLERNPVDGAGADGKKETATKAAEKAQKATRTRSAKKNAAETAEPVVETAEVKTEGIEA